MKANGTFDRDLERWLEDQAPKSGPAGLHDAVIERAGTMRQRPGWVVSVRGGGFAARAGAIGQPAVPVAYLLVVLGLILAIVVGVIAAGGLRSQPARPSAWTITGSMGTPRTGATAILLPDGKVLVAGGSSAVHEGGSSAPLASAELYDPATGSWTATGSMVTGRSGHTATLLADGKVLVAGGSYGPTASTLGGTLASAELYDPGTGSWTATGSMVTGRSGHTATLLPDGKVLVAGGDHENADGTGIVLASSELYDPATGSWQATGSMVVAHYGSPTATLLPDGKVLVAGGLTASVGAGAYTQASAELYDPATGSWTATGSMVTQRDGHTATLLADGKVLVAGGTDANTGSGDLLASAELYDPISGSWTATGSMVAGRSTHTATLLLDGTVLVTGGADAPRTQVSAELYETGTGDWVATSAMVMPRHSHSATLLPGGKVLVTGGVTDTALASAELFDPGTGR